MKFNDYLKNKNSIEPSFSSIKLDVNDNINKQIIEKKKEKRTFNFVSLSKAFALVIVVGLFIYINIYLFAPYPTSPKSVEKYEDSEYYEVIEKLNVITFEKPIYKNNASRILASMRSFFSSLFKGAVGSDGSNGINGGSSPEPSNPEDNYFETTDNQVNGIIESDIIKRSNKYIFYLDIYTLRVFDINKENTIEVASFNLRELYPAYHSFETCEMYLSLDCTKITIILPDYYRSNYSYSNTKIVNLDITDINNIRFIGDIDISGTYLSSRLVNDELLIITNHLLNKKKVNLDDYKTFIPFYIKDETEYYLDSTKIGLAENCASLVYSVLTKINQITFEVLDQNAYLSYSSNIYVSNNNIYLTNPFVIEEPLDNYQFTSESMTEIRIVNYTENFIKKESITVRGTILNQYSMDEYDGYLRIATTNITRICEKRTYQDRDYKLTLSQQRNSNLFIIDIKQNQIVSAVEEFAPPQEDIKSVRFDKDKAYICTSLGILDPVFAFDLSDISNITYKDTGTIPGFSTSLINFKDDYLLGIGSAESWDSVKVEIYKETISSVESVCEYVVLDATYSTDYKSYFIDRENGLFGFGYSSYDNGRKYNYCLLSLDNEELTCIALINQNARIEDYRAVLIDGYFYLFSNDMYKVIKLSE